MVDFSIPREPNVYALVGVPPEIQAYAMARYSRSADSMEDSIEAISSDRAATFLDTFYFQYGHKSIADLATITMAVEDISLLAAIELEDEPLWSGQERSTRYQDFKKSGWVMPNSMTLEASSRYRDLFTRVSNNLFDVYESLTERIIPIVEGVYPCPEGVSKPSYSRTVRARVFDVTRGILPLATRTSVGQITSARVLERQISRLLASQFDEVRDLATHLISAARETAFTPIGLYPEPISASPTLVKHVVPARYESEVKKHFASCAATHQTDGPQWRSGEYRVDSAVHLHTNVDPQLDLMASLLYENDDRKRSYAYWLVETSLMTGDEFDRLLLVLGSLRGQYDDLLRTAQVGYGLLYDLQIDLGSYRDFHRHRKCVQIRQPYSAPHDFVIGYDHFFSGLGEEVADKCDKLGVVRAFERAIWDALECSTRLPPELSPYLLPLASKIRVLFKMDLAEAGYITELRTKPGGHYAYRRYAYQMYLALQSKYPHFAKLLTVIDPDENQGFFNR